MNDLSVADIASLTGENGFGGNSAWVLILLFLIIFGGGFGNRMGDYGQFATSASQQEILFGQHFQNIDNKIDRIGNGIADATFALNSAIKDGNAGVASAVVAEGRNMQTLLSNNNADAIRQTASLKEAVHAEGEATRAMIQQNKIETLQAQVNELKTQNMFCGVPRINPYGYQIVPNPSGCGCNCGNI